MAVLTVLKAEHPVLRGKAKRVSRIDASLSKLIDDMVETMHATNGVGLAAPQVGVPLRL
ncbi:MAG: peptide deformylase, partial [Chloroflexota bacterium]